jgi:hypothetical protein
LKNSSVEKKSHQRLSETFEITEGQKLWDKRAEGISDDEFEQFKERQWGWMQKLATLKGIVGLGYFLLIIQAVSASRGSLSGTSLIVMNTNPVSGMLSTAAILIVTLAPLVLLTQEYRKTYLTWPKNFQNIVQIAALPALLYCPVQIVMYAVFSTTIYFAFVGLGKRFRRVQIIRIWALLNMPSFATGVIVMGILFTFWGTPSIPRVIPSQGNYAGQVVGLVNLGATATFVDFESGQVYSQDLNRVGTLSSCTLESQRSLFQVLSPNFSYATPCPK